MNAFLNLRTGTKFVLAFGFLILSLGGGLTVILRGTDAIQASQQRLVEQNFPISLALLELRSNLNFNRSLMLETILVTDRATQEKNIQEIQNRASHMDVTLQSLAVLMKGDSAALSRLKNYRSQLAAFRKVRESQFALVLGGDIEQARDLALGTQVESFAWLRAEALAWAEQGMEDSFQQVAANKQLVTREIRGVITLFAVLVLICIGMARLLARSVSKPLENISRVADKIAAGELNHGFLLATDRRDEVGHLAQAFTQMSDSLLKMAAVVQKIAAGDLSQNIVAQSAADVLGTAFAAMEDSLQQMTAELTGAIEFLSSETHEIAAAAVQFSACTKENDAAVGAASGAITSIYQNVRLTYQKIERIGDDAALAKKVAEDGQKAADQVTEAMSRVCLQMDLIAQSMAALDQQTQAAEQLVVAVEDLSRRSDSSASDVAEPSNPSAIQIRMIFGEIQRATYTALAYTKQGVHMVSVVEQQSLRAGEVVAVLANNIRESAVVATRISNACQQKLLGMAEVEAAIEKIQESSSETLAGVQQLEISANRLVLLSDKLKDQAGRFHL